MAGSGRESERKRLIELGSALHRAIDHGDVEKARCLLELGAPVDHQDASHWTPLHHAARRGLLDCVRLLLQYQADVNAAIENSLWTPLHWARCGVPQLDPSGVPRRSTHGEPRTPWLIVLISFVCVRACDAATTAVKRWLSS